jgi:hypothetical protein
MAKARGVSFKTVQRIWNLHGLKPHQSRTFKLSRDKHFVEKLTDVVGVYLNTPDKAVARPHNLRRVILTKEALQGRQPSPILTILDEGGDDRSLEGLAQLHRHSYRSRTLSK